MGATHYYNEWDPYCAAWLRNLMDAGHIPAGDIDTRSIEDVRPNELAGYVQCHFFAGIAGWPLALALAGWPVDRPVWTGSCPCQPFSAAGKGLGFEDERHLWPAWQHLIAQCRPPVIFGEQVASKDAEPWIDLVHADMEGMDYAFGCEPFPAAGIGAPHIRERHLWVADTSGAGLEIWRGHAASAASAASGRNADAGGCAFGGLDYPDHIRHRSQVARAGRRQQEANRSADIARGPGVPSGWVADANLDRQPPRGLSVRPGRQVEDAAVESGRGADRRPGPANGFWGSADWLGCTDGKWRPVEPGTFPLAHGIPNRVGRLRAYGNAIVPQAAAEFIRAYTEARGLSLATDQEIAA